jgi:predicted metal-dependent hydrolase
MRAISRIILSSASSDLVFAGGGHVRPLTVRRSAAARAMRLSVDPRDGTVRLSLPPRAALRPALLWVENKRDWIEGALAALPRARPIVPGAVIPFEGQPHTVVWQAGASRTVTLVDYRLLLGGPEEAVGQRVLRWMKGAALARLETQTHAVAARAGVTVSKVGIGDARSRWGSCSASGEIRYSWRLILAPPDVLEATVVHEVAHRLHMHHGPEFHHAVKRLLGRDPAGERQWLRTHGAELYWYGRDH